MVQAYLGKPNYTNAMNTALRTRLAYDQARRRRGGGGGGGGTSSIRTPGPQAAPAGSPEARAEYRNQMRAETSEEQGIAQQAADVAKTEAATERLDAGTARETQRTNLMADKAPDEAEAAKLKNEMGEANLKKEQIAQQKTILDNMLQYAPTLTRESYRDWLDWGKDSGLAQGAMLPAEKIEAMSDVEWKVQQSKIESMQNLGPKKIKALADAKIKEDKAAAADKKLLEKARDDYAKYKGAADTLRRTGGLSTLEMMFLTDKEKKEVAGKSKDEQVALLERRALLIKMDHPELQMGPEPATSPGGWKEYQ